VNQASSTKILTNSILKMLNVNMNIWFPNSQLKKRYSRK